MFLPLLSTQFSPISIPPLTPFLCDSLLPFLIPPSTLCNRNLLLKSLKLFGPLTLMMLVASSQQSQSSFNWTLQNPFLQDPQYPLSREAQEVICSVIESLLQQGILVRTKSPCNTPILPVQKKSSGKLAHPLYDIPEPLQWSPTADSSFELLKQALSSAPTLGLPDYNKPFTLYYLQHFCNK